MVRLIVTDLDGTLLRDDKTISPFTGQVLERCRSAGLRVAVATARPIRSVKPYLAALACDAVICHNGAILQVVEPGIGLARSGEHFGIPNGMARGILSDLAARWPGKRLSLETDDTLYANFDVSVFWGNIDFVRTDFTALPDSVVDKLLVEVESASELETVQSLLPPELYAQQVDGRICMIMNRSATKLNAIRVLCSRWEIKLEETVAFGDDYNDLEMITGCGIGVAMENAVPEVREASDAVAATNEADGVAAWLLNHVLKKGAGVGTMRRILHGKKEFLPLLLLADPSEAMVDRYLDVGEMHVLMVPTVANEDGCGAEEAAHPRSGRNGSVEAQVVCEAVVNEISPEGCELKNLATLPEMQGRGYASDLVRRLFRIYADRYRYMQVGTADSGVAFYERLGFRRSHVVKEFFTQNYPEPILENGQPCVDMIYLRVELKPWMSAPPGCSNTK